MINSCAVTAEAVRQARQTIRKLKRERPGARIVVSRSSNSTRVAKRGSLALSVPAVRLPCTIKVPLRREV